MSLIFHRASLTCVLIQITQEVVQIRLCVNEFLEFYIINRLFESIFYVPEIIMEMGNAYL